MNVDVAVEAIDLGSLDAVLALGLTIVFNATRVINFAQGESLILGAAIGYQVGAVAHLGAVVVMLLVGIGAVLAGLVSERLIMLPVRRSGSGYAWIIATLAVALIAEAVFGLLFPSTLLRPAPLVDATWRVLGARVTAQQVLFVGYVLAVMVGYELFLSRTMFGSAVRATAHDPETTSTFGVSVRGVVVWSFVAAAVLTAFAGVLVAPISFFQPTDGLTYTVSGFVAMVIGGLGSTRGALAGGMVVGGLEAVLRNTISPSFGEIFVVVVLAAILVVRPEGLFQRTSVTA